MVIVGILRFDAYSCRRAVLVSHTETGIDITGKILQCLRPGAWLNDEVYLLGPYQLNLCVKNDFLFVYAFRFVGHKCLPWVAQRKGKERAPEVFEMSLFQHIFLQ